MKSAALNQSAQIFERVPVYLSGTLNAASPPGTVWDASCTRSSDRAAIYNAWNAALNLAQSAYGGLSGLRADLPNPYTTDATTRIPVPQNGNYIAWTDPAYTQLFGALSGRIGDVGNVYQKMLANMPNQYGQDRGGRELRLVCNTMRDYNNALHCTPGYEAITFDRYPNNDVEAKYEIPNTALILFCPGFFDAPSQQDVLAHAEASAGPSFQLGGVPYECDLTHLATQAVTMLHEWAHLTWIKGCPANPDPYGYAACARSVRSGGKVNWNLISKFAEAYAFYAQYHYWNNLPFCNNGQGCIDVWPPSVAKPNPRSFS
ncbi:hypothetical protein MMC27_004987 [Xylographa pallens]|nr:hypothetical protein [Xylographa pallens]